MEKAKSPQTDRVVDETYATTLDPERYDALLSAWSDYIAELPGVGGDEIFAGDPVSDHFRRALAILDRMGRVEARDQSARTIANQMPGPALILNPDCVVLSCNAACQEVLGGNLPETLTDLELDAETDARLRAWIAPNTRPGGGDPFLMLSADVGPEAVQTRILATRISLNAGPGTSAEDAILLAAVGVRFHSAIGDSLAKAYGLSVAELDVAVRLAEGETPDTIAKQRGASLPTVRTQIRALLAKLDVPSVTDAVRVLTGFGATMNAASAIARQAPARRDIDHLMTQHTMTLNDGRRLSWYEMGDADGRPVLFFHHLFLGPFWTDPGIEALARQGWRVIAPSRPGFGMSDRVAVATSEQRIESFTDSCEQLLNRLGIERVLVVGHANGMIHAQDFAAHRPERVRALLSIGGETSWEEGMEDSMPWQIKIMIQTLLRAPSAIGFLARATVAFIDTGREDFVLKTLHKDSPLEQRIARRPEVRDVIFEGLRHTVQQGAHGLTSEIKLALQDRRDVARRVKCRFRVVHGLQDNVFQPAMFDLFASSVPGVELVPVADAGQYLLYSHWPNVIAEMEKLWRETAEPESVRSKAGARLV
ncbi:MAG: alpha/beta fold hydrolase [Pseudomonadota bacterium]|nr:alpha/beta fold hydrolase [Pseudomonadota bacterium]